MWPVTSQSDWHEYPRSDTAIHAIPEKMRMEYEYNMMEYCKKSRYMVYLHFLGLPRMD